MKLLKLLPVMAVILAFAFILPASAMHNPVCNHQSVTRMAEDHPWGGDAVPTGDFPESGGLSPSTFTGTPFFFIDITRIFISIEIRFDRNSDLDVNYDQNGDLLPDTYTQSSNNNQGPPQRGN